MICRSRSSRQVGARRGTCGGCSGNEAFGTHRVNIGRVKLLLKLSAAALFAAGGGAVVAAVMWPMPDLRESAQPDPADGSANLAAAGDAVPLATLAPAWSLDLRRPLVDAP